MDIEKNYNNVYRTMKKNKLNNFQFDCPVKIDNEYMEQPIFLLSCIIDTDDVDLRVPDEDIDWMSQFMPGAIPGWIYGIEDLTERQAMMELMGFGEDFDITQSPFYNNVILIGF